MQKATHILLKNNVNRNISQEGFHPIDVIGCFLEYKITFLFKLAILFILNAVLEAKTTV